MFLGPTIISHPGKQRRHYRLFSALPVSNRLFVIVKTLSSFSRLQQHSLPTFSLLIPDHEYYKQQQWLLAPTSSKTSLPRLEKSLVDFKELFTSSTGLKG